MKLAAFLAGLIVGAWLVAPKPRRRTAGYVVEVDPWADLYRLPNVEPEVDQVGGWG